jgi:uncharacterized protein YkwD
MYKFFLILSLAFFSHNPGEDEVSRAYILEKINAVRSQGCYCGWRWMPPVHPLKWDDTLYESAKHHAEEMATHRFFAHYSKCGKDIGTRLSDFGYDWQMAGENIGEGQDTFDQVLDEWIRSRSHCRMLMSPKVEEVAVAKYRDKWVQHFGKKMPLSDNNGH